MGRQPARRRRFRGGRPGAARDPRGRRNMAAGKKLKKTERQARILGELRAQPAIRISDLAGDFGVSTETIRRDLDELGQQGMLSRTYGGAAPRPFGAEPTLSERYKEHVSERERVGVL